MTLRGMSSQFSTQLTQSNLTAYHLYEADFPDGSVYFTDLPYDTTFGSNTYTGVGSALGYDAIQEVAGLQSNGINIYFNAANASLLALLLGQNLIDRQVFVYRGLLDTNNQPVVDPLVIFQGRSDSATLTEDPGNGTMKLVLVCLDENADFERVNGRRTNDQEQQAIFLGDKCFSFIDIGKVVKW